MVACPIISSSGDLEHATISNPKLKELDNVPISVCVGWGSVFEWLASSVLVTIKHTHTKQRRRSGKRKRSKRTNPGLNRQEYYSSTIRLLVKAFDQSTDLRELVADELH